MKTKDEVEQTLSHTIFLVGTPRSGTTWLHRMLTSHFDIIGGPESAFFIGFQGAFNNILQRKENRREALLLEYWSKNALQHRMYELWLETFSDFVVSNDGNTFCEKSPSHALHIDAIDMILPKAKVIHIIRDSRSTTASMLAASKGWGSYWAPKTAKDAAISWYLHVSKARESGSKLGSNRYLEVYYEDLKKHTEVELKRIFDFVGVKYTSADIKEIILGQNFEYQKEIGGSPLKQGITRSEPVGFFRKGHVDGWKKDLSFMEKLIVWRYTRKLMKTVGYDWMGRI